MRIVKFLLVFVIAFLIAWVIIFTFNQEPFSRPVAAKIPFYKTREIAIYWYVAFAFILGLLIGFVADLFHYISLKGQLRKQKHELKNAAQELSKAREEIASRDKVISSFTTQAKAGHEPDESNPGLPPGSEESGT